MDWHCGWGAEGDKQLQAPSGASHGCLWTLFIAQQKAQQFGVVVGDGVLQSAWAPPGPFQSPSISCDKDNDIYLGSLNCLS